ncbi:hypothetical protein Taro_030826 [Colocasia esculenta]|uniref:Transcription factor CBF/NF-Y/archaeal histone domain-containing protein n=1 Tax=Colocasia esculenta TaxID=4460 RepID=A0A843W4I8_COLES|nr:hypothetical protein [Colocasia esculenta]
MFFPQKLGGARLDRGSPLLQLSSQSSPPSSFLQRPISPQPPIRGSSPPPRAPNLEKRFPEAPASVALQLGGAPLPSSPGAGGSHESPGDGSPQSNVREQDRFLPIANISRIMKKALPANAKIAKDAKDTMQECVSEFISFITSEASDKCQREKRKTINGDDLLWAMATLGFEDYIEPLKNYLQKYREGDAKGSGKKDGSVSQAGSQSASSSQTELDCFRIHLKSTVISQDVT